MEAFSATLERRLQLTVRTLGQAVQTPSGILDITFYSNIGLEQNWHRWKANKILYKLNIRTVIIIVRKDPFWMETYCIRTAVRKIPELLFGQEKLGPSGWAKAPVGDARATKSIFDSILGFQSL